MRLTKFLGASNALTLAILAERWFGLPFVLEGKGLEAHPVPWYWFRIQLNAPEIVHLMNVCAQCGARTDLLFLNEVLEEMQTP